jgi:hypothetical protein
MAYQEWRWMPCQTRSLDENGRCCGRKPIIYKGGSWRSPDVPQRFCGRCKRAYALNAPHQIENWAFKVEDGGFSCRVNEQVALRTILVEAAEALEHARRLLLAFGASADWLVVWELDATLSEIRAELEPQSLAPPQK